MSRLQRMGCVRAALRPTRRMLQKKQTTAGYMANAGKVGGDEKWAQAAMEYIYEKNHLNDARKRAADVRYERSMSAAYDRYSAVNEAHFSARLARLVSRMSEALEVMQQLGMHEAVEEAVLLNSEQPPGNFRRPSLTPPLAGYEPGFGLDVPQLRSQQMEYPPLRRPSDSLEFGVSAPEDFPYVEAHSVEDMCDDCEKKLDECHGALREAAPLTGVEGEAWEAYVALQHKALRRQKLICELAADSEFRERYNADEAVRHEEWARRGLLPLDIEPPRAQPEEVHYAQVPAYQPFREF